MFTYLYVIHVILYILRFLSKKFDTHIIFLYSDLLKKLSMWMEISEEYIVDLQVSQ